MKTTVKHLPKSQVELTVQTDEKDLASAEEKVLKQASRHINVPGFRPGKAPPNFVREKLKKDFISKETYEQLTNDVFTKAVVKENLKPISEPEIKIENKDALPKFKFIFAILPKVKLGDYKKAIRELKSGKKIETAKKKKKQAERLAKLGKQTPKEQNENLEERILETLLQTVELEVPEILIENEVEGRMLPEQEAQIKRLGLTLENYLKLKQGKSLSKYKEELRQEAERIIKLRLILQEIAVEEQLKTIGSVITSLKQIAI